MKIRILAACRIGKRKLSPYDKEDPEVTEDEAVLLVGVGRAEYINENAKDLPDIKEGDGDPVFVSSLSKLGEALELTESELDEFREIDGAPEKEPDGHNVTAWTKFVEENSSFE